MLDQETRLDIRVIKYQDYVKKHPDKPYGYYCLGVLNYLLGYAKQSEKMYQKALEKDKHYSLAKIGILELMLEDEKYVSAAQYYNANRFDLQRKKIFIIKLNRILGRFYHNYYKVRNKGWFSTFLYGRSIHGLVRMFDHNQDNVIIHMILGIHYLKTDRQAEKALVLYHICVFLDGIDDIARWEMVKTLSEAEKSILTDPEVAVRFTFIPPDNYNTDYSNFILTQYISNNLTSKINKSLDYMFDNRITVSKKNLWKYILLCRESDILDSRVFECCKKLVQAGWIDKYITETLTMLKSKGIVSDSKEIDRIINLFGYSA